MTHWNSLSKDRISFNYFHLAKILLSRHNFSVMNAYFLCFFRGLILGLTLLFAFSLQAQDKPTVLVSIAPYRFFVNKIADDTVQVLLFVPAGTSAHTFEPSPKQMLAASQSFVWFRTGESFETRAITAFKKHNPEMDIVDLRHGLDLIYVSPGDEGHCSCCHCTANGMDLHFWLSPGLAKQQAQMIANVLMEHYPEHQEMYQKRLEAFLKELDTLDRDITTMLAPLKIRTILVSHPAYAYFCRDYGLNQLSVEFEGKDPTPYQLTQLLQRTRALGIKTVFIQREYSNKGAKLVASELGARVVTLDPYAEDYLNSMRFIAQQFADR